MVEHIGIEPITGGLQSLLASIGMVPLLLFLSLLALSLSVEPSAFFTPAPMSVPRGCAVLRFACEGQNCVSMPGLGRMRTVAVELLLALSILAPHVASRAGEVRTAVPTCELCILFPLAMEPEVCLHCEQLQIVDPVVHPYIIFVVKTVSTGDGGPRRIPPHEVVLQYPSARVVNPSRVAGRCINPSVRRCHVGLYRH